MLEELFVEIVKKSVLNMVEKQYVRADKEWIDRWLNGEVSSLDAFVKDNVKEIKLFKGIAVKVCKSLTEEEILQAIKNARPNMMHVWETQKVKDRIHQEWVEINEYIEKM